MGWRKIVRAFINGWKGQKILWRETAVECNVDPDKLFPYLQEAGVPESFKTESKQYHILFFNELKRKHPFLKLRKEEA